MNSDQSIKQFLITLSEAFPGNVTAGRMQIYFTVLKETLAHANLKTLMEEIVLSSEFFPSAKEIKERVKGKTQTPRQLAEEFVDRMITILQGSGNAYEQAGPENYRLWKEHVGIVRFDLQNIGDPKFYRGQWVDRMERAFTGKSEMPALPTNLIKLIGKGSAQ